MTLFDPLLYRHSRQVVNWFLEKYSLDAKVKIEIVPYKKIDCWGSSAEGTKHKEYTIWIAKDQGLRDFIATVVHEMVHIRQWENKKWTGTGEAEANRLQYKLADKVWDDGII